MAKSNDRTPLARHITIGEKYGPAMEIDDQTKADAYFARLVEHTLRFGPPLTQVEAEDIERKNLGYYAGYYSAETRERVERLFRCHHPIFGAIAERGQPMTQEALAVGRMMGERLKGQTNAP